MAGESFTRIGAFYSHHHTLRPDPHVLDAWVHRILAAVQLLQVVSFGPGAGHHFSRHNRFRCV